MKQLRIKKEPEIVCLSPSSPPESADSWIDVVLFILVCCLSAWGIFLTLGSYP